MPLWPLLGSVAAVGCATACGPMGHDAEDDPAVWGIAPHQHLTAKTTAFDSVITRNGCSGGEQGEPQTPIVDYTKTTITITVRMKPHIDSGSCVGSPGVPYRFHLTQPLGLRTMIDGACIPPGTDGPGTTLFCSDHGVRLRWHNGKPQPIQVSY
jgi:hypothetical protein